MNPIILTLITAYVFGVIVAFAVKCVRWENGKFYNNKYTIGNFVVDVVFFPHWILVGIVWGFVYVVGSVYDLLNCKLR